MKAYEHVKYLADSIGRRVFGPVSESKALDACMQATKFGACGLDVRIEKFSVSPGFPFGKSGRGNLTL